MLRARCSSAKILISFGAGSGAGVGASFGAAGGGAGSWEGGGMSFTMFEQQAGLYMVFVWGKKDLRPRPREDSIIESW